VEKGTNVIDLDMNYRCVANLLILHVILCGP